MGCVCVWGGGGRAGEGSGKMECSKECVGAEYVVSVYLCLTSVRFILIVAQTLIQ